MDLFILKERMPQSDSTLVKKRIERLQKQWDVVNTTTIIEWISASNLNVLLLNTYLMNLRSILRFNTLWSLVISSVTSTISVTQFTISDSDNIYLSYGIKVLIFLTSVTTSLITGYIKVEKIQETIELLEEHKKNWLSFMNSLTSELQVGMQFRNDATALINAKKDEYNSVSARQIEIPPYIHKQVSQFLVTKRNVEKRIEQVQRQVYEEDRQYNRIMCGLPSCIPSCFTICCCFYWLTYCCRSKCCDKTENDYNMEKIATKLSLFHTINKEMTNELLELMNIFQGEVKGLAFDRQNDMFNYEIINNRYVKDVEAEKKGMTVIRLKPDTECEGNRDGLVESVYSVRSSKPIEYKSRRDLLRRHRELRRKDTTSYRPALMKSYDAKSEIQRRQIMRNTLVDIGQPKSHPRQISDDSSGSSATISEGLDRVSPIPPLPPSDTSPKDTPAVHYMEPTQPKDRPQSLIRMELGVGSAEQDQGKDLVQEKEAEDTEDT